MYISSDIYISLTIMYFVPVFVFIIGLSKAVSSSLSSYIRSKICSLELVVELVYSRIGRVVY